MYRSQKITTYLSKKIFNYVNKIDLEIKTATTWLEWGIKTSKMEWGIKLSEVLQPHSNFLLMDIYRIRKQNPDKKRQKI